MYAAGSKAEPWGQVDQIVLQPDQLGFPGGDDHLQRQHHRLPRRLSTWAVTPYTPGWVLMMFWEVMRMLLLMSPSSTSGGGEPVQQGHGLVHGVYQGPGQGEAGAS